MTELNFLTGKIITALAQMKGDPTLCIVIYDGQGEPLHTINIADQSVKLVRSPITIH